MKRRTFFGVFALPFVGAIAPKVVRSQYVPVSTSALPNTHIKLANGTELVFSDYARLYDKAVTDAITNIRANPDGTYDYVVRKK